MKNIGVKFKYFPKYQETRKGHIIGPKYIFIYTKLLFHRKAVLPELHKQIGDYFSKETTNEENRDG